MASWTHDFTSSFSLSFLLVVLLRNSACCSNIQDQLSLEERKRERERGRDMSINDSTCMFTYHEYNQSIFNLICLYQNFYGFVQLCFSIIEEFLFEHDFSNQYMKDLL